MATRRVLAGLLLATTFLHAPHALAQEKQDVLAPIEIEGEAGNGSADFDGYKAKKDAGAGKSDQPLADSANTQKVPDYAVVDAAIRYEKDNFKAALNVSNLFDKASYVPSCNITCFYGESREISLTMGYKW